MEETTASKRDEQNTPHLVFVPTGHVSNLDTANHAFLKALSYLSGRHEGVDTKSAY